MSDFYKKILENNKNWVEEKLSISPDYFNNLAEGQQPPLLWIGCSDSRVPANEIIERVLAAFFSNFSLSFVW